MKESCRVGRPKGEDIENTARRRKQLIDAVVTSIAENGVAATTLSTVAEAAGLSRGTAIFYFKSKDALLSETFRFRLEEYRSAWIDALNDAGPDPIDRLLAIVFAAYEPDLITPKNLALWHSFWPEAARNQSLSDLSDRYDAERLAALEAICAETRPVMAGDLWTPKSVCQALESMTDGVHSVLHYSPDYMSVDDARHVVATMLVTIYPSRAACIFQAAKADASRVEAASAAV